MWNALSILGMWVEGRSGLWKRLGKAEKLTGGFGAMRVVPMYLAGWHTGFVLRLGSMTS
jgi:hypothetical protein